MGLRGREIERARRHFKPPRNFERAGGGGGGGA